MGKKGSYASNLAELSCHRNLDGCHIWVVKFQTSKLHQASPCNMESFRCNDNERTRKKQYPKVQTKQAKMKDQKKKKLKLPAFKLYAKTNFLFSNCQRKL